MQTDADYAGACDTSNDSAHDAVYDVLDWVGHKIYGEISTFYSLFVSLQEDDSQRNHPLLTPC